MDSLFASPVTMGLLALNIVASMIAFSNQAFMAQNVLWVGPMRDKGEWLTQTVGLEARIVAVVTRARGTSSVTSLTAVMLRCLPNSPLRVLKVRVRARTSTR